MPDLVRLLRLAREEAGLSQAQAASRRGVHRTAWSARERGAVVITAHDFVVLGVPPPHGTPDNSRSRSTAPRGIDWDEALARGLTDTTLAARLGVTVSAVAHARATRQIAAVPSAPADTSNRGIAWDEQPLGEMSDRELARRLGVHQSTVTEARNRRGIEPYRRGACLAPQPTWLDKAIARLDGYMPPGPLQGHVDERGDKVPRRWTRDEVLAAIRALPADMRASGPVQMLRPRLHAAARRFWSGWPAAREEALGEAPTPDGEGPGTRTSACWTSRDP